MMEYHRLPEMTPDPVSGPVGTEIRFPECSGKHNLRARKELSQGEESHEAR